MCIRDSLRAQPVSCPFEDRISHGLSHDPSLFLFSEMKHLSAPLMHHSVEKHAFQRLGQFLEALRRLLGQKVIHLIKSDLKAEVWVSLALTPPEGAIEAQVLVLSLLVVSGYDGSSLFQELFHLIIRLEFYLETVIHFIGTFITDWNSSPVLDLDYSLVSLAELKSVRNRGLALLLEQVFCLLHWFCEVWRLHHFEPLNVALLKNPFTEVIFFIVMSQSFDSWWDSLFLLVHRQEFLKRFVILSLTGN